MRSRYGRRAFRAYPIRCVGERIKVTGVPEFREVAWRACILAVTASKTSEAAVFITSDTAQLCVIGGADKLVAESLEPIADLIKQFVQNDGKIWLCPVCAKVKGITNDDLIAGVKIAGAPKTMTFLASGAKILA